MNHRLLLACLAAATLSPPFEGYELWLRYHAIDARSYPTVQAAVSELVAGERGSPTLDAAGRELVRGLTGLMGRPVELAGAPTRAGALLFGTPQSSTLIANLSLALERTGSEGYVIRSVSLNGKAATVIAAKSDIGVLYGAFHFLRLIQTRQALTALDILSRPRTGIRVLDHWDNLDRHVERGYAGQSIWDWHKLPDWLDPRYTDYARACASAGINNSVLTNVNANATSLTPAYLESRGAGKRIPALRGAGVSHGKIQRAHRAWRAENRRSSRSGGPRLVEGQGGRDLPLHTGFRRLPGQGEFRGPTRPAGLPPHPCGWSQHAGREPGAAWWHRHVARVRLLERSVR
jgi:hypothetical protein